MDYSKLQEQANKLHRQAKNGKIKINNIEYNIDFDFYEGIYIVTANKEEIVRLNTRKITEAKQWLKEWLDS